MKKLGTHRGRRRPSTTRLIAPDLADKVIPNLTVDDSFDRPAFNQLVQAFLGLADGNGGPDLRDAAVGRARHARRAVGAPREAARGRRGARGPARARRRPRRPPPRPSAGGTGATDARQPAAVRPVDVRVQVLNGSGVQGAAGNTSQALHQARLRARRRRQRQPGHRRPRPRSATARATRPRPSCGEPRCPAPSWWPTRRSRAPTSCWCSARTSPGWRQPQPHHHGPGRRRRPDRAVDPRPPASHRRIARGRARARPGLRGPPAGRRVRLPTLPGMSWSTGSPLRAFLGRFVISLGGRAASWSPRSWSSSTGDQRPRRQDPPRRARRSRRRRRGAPTSCIIGSDTRAFVDNPADATEFGDPRRPQRRGQRSDTIMVAHVEPELAADLRRVVPPRPDGRRPGLRPARTGSTRRTPSAAPQLRHRHPEGNFGINDQPLPRGRLPELPGDRRRPSATCGCTCPGAMRDQETGLNTPYGARLLPARR